MTSKRQFSRHIAAALLVVTSLTTVTAQSRYTFNPTDYVSTDNSRAPQSAFTYNQPAGTLTIKASGANNIAFQMKSDADGKYFIGADQQLYVVEATNIMQTPAASYVWWFNGANHGSQEPATNYYKTSDGHILVVWNIAGNSLMSANMDFTKDRIKISANGGNMINALGLTSTTGTTTIHRIDYLEPYGLPVAYPELIGQLGYTPATLTADIVARLDQATVRADALLEGGVSESLSAATAKAKAVVKSLAPDDYAKAYTTLRDMQDAIATCHITQPVTTAEAIPSGLHVCQKDLHTYILFYSDKVVRVLKSHSTIDAIDKLSMSVIRQPSDIVTLNTNLTTTDAVSVGTDKLSISVSRADGHIEFYRPDGTRLVGEQPYGTAFTERNHINQYDRYNLRSTFSLDPSEHIYGMGQIQDDRLDRRGCTLDLEQWNMRVCIPYYQSTRGYGLFWDNYSPSTFSDDYVDTYFESTGSEIDYYVLCGDDSQDVMTCMRWLTGEATMLPLWNFGLYQSKERYKSADETMSIIQKYRSLRVPIDCVVQDWQYWGDNNHWNALEFLNPTFQNYQQMIDTVHANNAHLLISVWANFGSATKPFAELDRLGRLIHVTSYPTDARVYPYDVWSSTARDIYWRYMYNGLVSKGVDAYWMDSTEPDYTRHSDSEMDYLTETGRTWRVMRNSFVLGQVSGAYNHHREQQQADATLATKRVNILTRSGFAGQQRYGAQTWSGDITASWTTLRRQIPAALGFTTCGIPYWNNDNGGFFVGYHWGDNGPFSDPAYRALYLRWTQFSTFTGMLRFHGSGHASEIWQLGSQGDAAGDYDQVLRYIRMRYSLLPYIYSTSWQITHNHRSLMTALPLAFGADTLTYDKKYEYMFGDAILVCPVVEEGQTTSHNYLPAGTRWIDFWTGQTFEGGQTVTKQANLDIIPLYVRAGSILPWGPDVQYSNEKPWDALELRVYPGADGGFTLYEDELDGYGYEQGAYTEIPIRWDDATHTLTIGGREGKGFKGMLTKRKFNIVVVTPAGAGTGDAHATRFTKTVTYTGKAVSVKLNVNYQAEVSTDCTDQYIQNPSFEADGRTLTGAAPRGWSADINTQWWGVNEGGTAGNPPATDGRYIFGVWDGSTGRHARLSQEITLPEGDYRLMVDMHASNRANMVRLGRQHLFADTLRAYFADQVTSAGIGDEVPMQTISLDFCIADAGGRTISIGVDTDGAPYETWYKVDNFRLLNILQHAGTTDPADGIRTIFNSDNTSTNSPSHKKSTTYDLTGRAISQPRRGLYIMEGEKVLIK